MIKFKFILFMLIIISFSVFGSEDQMTFNEYFNKGEYENALSTLKTMEKKELIWGQINYLTAICYSRLQEFDKAIKYFEIAINEKNSNKDLYYEYGQALYATNNLKKAQDAFKKSLENNYYQIQSQYYIAYISQVMEEFQNSKNEFLKLISDPQIDNKTLQVAQFQLAETILAGIKNNTFTEENKKDSEKINELVIPLMKSAVEINKKNDIVAEIEQRIVDIKTEYGLDPNIFINGKKLNPKHYSGYFTEKIKFDDNITSVSEENNLQQSTKKSFISFSELYTKYEMPFLRRIIISPELRFNFTHHSKQTDSDVYQNDSYTLFPSIKNQFEHTLFSKPASIILNLNYGKTNKAWGSTHSRISYANEYSIELGESFNYFNAGDSTVKAKYKDYHGINKAINNKTLNLNFNQILSVKNRQILILYFESSFINNYNNKSSSTDTYYLRGDYLLTELFPTYNYTFALATTITDTKLMKATRGLEFTITPSIDITKNLSTKTKLNFNYEYTKNISKSTNYDYSKNVFTLSLQLNF